MTVLPPDGLKTTLIKPKQTGPSLWPCLYAFSDSTINYQNLTTTYSMVAKNASVLEESSALCEKIAAIVIAQQNTIIRDSIYAQ